MLATSGQVVPLFLVLPNGGSGFYPQAEIFDSAGASVDTVDLEEVDVGVYWASWTVPDADKYLVKYAVFEDASHTTLSPIYGFTDELVEADSASGGAGASAIWDALLNAHSTPNSFGMALRLLLAVAGHANMRMDQMVFNSGGFQTAGRLRAFANSADASASSPGGIGEGEFATVNLTGLPDATFPTNPSTVLGIW